MARFRRVIRASWGVDRVSLRHALRLKDVTMAPLNACRGGPSTSDTRVICASENPKLTFFFSFSLPPTTSPKNGATNIVITISCCVFLARRWGYGIPFGDIASEIVAWVVLVYKPHWKDDSD